MSALEWRMRMRIAPKLRHEHGIVVADLGGDTVQFPTEADARFFVEAYTDIVTVSDQETVLRCMVDEETTAKLQARVLELEAENRALASRNTELTADLVHEVARRTAATKRATLLAQALRKKSKAAP